VSEQIIESTEGTFTRDVLEASRTMPVLVDFWADWCGPCKMLAPVLERVAEAFAGRARVVKVNTDAEQRLAAEHGIRSLPTVRVFRHGKAVDEIIGVQPESAIRAMVERYLDKPSDKDRAEAARLLADGRPEEAVLLLEKILREEPENEPARVQLVEALIAAGQLGEAATQLESLPVNLLDSPELKMLEARLNLARTLTDAPDLETLRKRVEDNPSDLESRNQLAAREFGAGREEAALGQWLEILRRDRNFGDGAARQSLLQAFELMRDREDVVHAYRRQMMALLH
jgi:putative thioredoxin